MQNWLPARLARTLACVLLMVLLSEGLTLAFDERRFVPQRGALSHDVHEMLHVATLGAVYFLIFFVVDATVFCVAFVRGLRRQAASWLPDTLDRFERRYSVPRKYLDAWVDLCFVGQRTACMTQLIYFPFAALSLVLVSRNRFFDDWTMPIGGIVIAAAGAAVVFGCAVALRLTAERSREAALDEARDTLMRLSTPAGNAPPVVLGPDGRPMPPTVPPRDDAHSRPSPEQMKQLIQRIESLDEGALAPFSQQPLLKTIQLPFATLGGTSLLDHLSLAKL